MTTTLDSRILVSVCTYGRPDGLRSLLDRLIEEVADVDRILVVDNNPANSGALDGFEETYPTVRFVHEATPGIPAARNRILDELGTEWAVVFVDDDEVPKPGWLESHRRFALATDADVIFGPVISRYADGASRAVTAGGILDRKRYPTGTAMPFGATNNTFVKVSALETFGPLYFDSKFTASGGSDVDFFDRMRRRGAKLVWNDAAEVEELIPATRASRDWCRARSMRMGHNLVHLQLRSHGKLRLRVLAYARMVIGAVLLLWDAPRRRITQQGNGRVWTGLGMIEALRGEHRAEYVREPA